MATNGTHADGVANGEHKEQDIEKATSHMSHDERRAALHAARFGYGPLAHIGTRQAAEALPGEHRSYISITLETDLLQLLVVNSNLVSISRWRAANSPILLR
jgi:hypothetical protein